MRSVAEVLCAGTSRGALGPLLSVVNGPRCTQSVFTVLMAVPQWQWKTAAERKCVFVTLYVGVGGGDDEAGSD